MGTNDEQYERIGRDFITGKEDHFSKKQDQAQLFIRNLLPDLRGKSVLDVGCGHGRDVAFYETLGASDVFGIDSSKFMIGEAKKIVKILPIWLLGVWKKCPLAITGLMF
jgi:SAM-dependent methyltransferase